MLNVKIGVQAYFKCVAVDTTTRKETELTDWFPNLVLNAGLDRMSQGAWINRVMVGSGNSTPLITQTSLDNFVASTTTRTEHASTRQLTNLPYYYSLKTTFRFAQGAAAGNLSEIAMGWADNSCWNRSLIKDSNGNPTTITVKANEFLDILTELRIYPNLNDVVSDVDLKNEDGDTISTHTVTVRPNMFIDLIHSGSYELFATAVRLADGINNMTNTIRVRAGDALLNSISQNVTGTTIVDTHGSAGNNSYPSLKSCVYKLPFTITQALGLHKVISVKSRLGDWKFEYNPPISKDNTQTLEHNFMLTWGRYEP
ncbi:hypothetical protein EAH57_15530 [Acinetobacter sp. 2JN-4]|uniref:hypothetical protein n=1 Tax=Acinetobacter sp. 2JN-4 TaxID=2479844 RepID=UPI000EF991F0|nr:hypothetical protein [Acinetobacter sp. 2JN-4]RLZ06647.1 hypothetical protein EAH57_15530 [Acinetobacter sp. 2JN-4]